jgi:hypothetical protein
MGKSAGGAYIDICVNDRHHGYLHYWCANYQFRKPRKLRTMIADIQSCLWMAVINNVCHINEVRM